MSPKFFSKKSKLDPQISPKVFKFSKMAILRYWKYPIFVPKVYKIIKLRQLFLSKCPENNFNIFTLMDVCVSLIFFLNSKTNGGKSPAKITKSTKLRQFFDVNFERFKMGFWKIFQRKILHFIILFPFLTFFLLN